MSDVIDFDAADENNAGTIDTPQQQLPPPVDPTEVAHEVARILSHGQRMSQQAAPVRSAMEMELENLVKEGYNAEALKVIARIRAAEKSDEARQMYAQQQQRAYEAFQNEIWKTSVEIFEQYAERLPVLEEAKEGVLKRFHSIFHGDPEFKAEIVAISRGEAPSRKSIAKAMGKAVDIFCQKAGIQSSAAPISLSTAKPTPAPRATKGGDFDSLDYKQKKLYNALKGTLGEDKALASAREMYSD